MTFVLSQQWKVMMRSGLSRLSQETLAILGVGVALAALILTNAISVRGEFQAVRAEIQAVRAESRADREAIRAEARADREAIRAEARADREALRAEARADREAFQSQILRLTEQQGVLSARLDGLHDPPATHR